MASRPVKGSVPEADCGDVETADFVQGCRIEIIVQQAFGHDVPGSVGDSRCLRGEEALFRISTTESPSCNFFRTWYPESTLSTRR